MLWDIAFKNLRKRKLRTILTIIGVAVAVQLYLLLNSILGVYSHEIERQVSSFAGKIIVEQQTKESQGTADIIASGSSLKTETAEELLNMEGIERDSSSALIYIPVVRSLMPYMPPEVLAVGIETGHEEAFLGSLGAESGSVTLQGPADVILGQNAASYYQPESSDTALEPGQTIEILGKTLNIIGILEKGSQIYNNAVILPLGTAQEMFDRSNTVSSVILTAERMEDMQTLKAEITGKFPSLSVSTQDDMIKNISGILEGLNKFMSLIRYSIIILAIIIITIVILVTVLEQRREIGILRALGAKRWRIFGMIASESMIISFLGATLALLLVIVYIRWGMKELINFSEILQVWGQSAIVAIVMGTVASIIPAWQAIRVEPIEVLRYE